MILSMRMQNIALIEQLTIDFSEGMHVLTGETGAGKSIVVDAVNLVLGGRADRDLIRTGTDKAFVEAVFDISDTPGAAEFLESQQIECDGLLTLYREITRSGRNLCRVCGMVMPLSVLREAADMLMDVHGQHEHQFLMDARHHLRFLDESGDEQHQQLLGQVTEAYRAFITKHRQYARLVKENERKQNRMQELERALEELEKARLTAGEEEKLLQEQAHFRHQEKIEDALRTCHDCLSAGDGESALTLLHRVKESLAGIADIDPAYASLSQRAESAYYEMEELSFEASSLLEKNEYSPQKRERVEDRLDLIRKLEKKYGETIPVVLAAQEQMREEYEAFQSLDETVAKTGAEDKKLLQSYRRLARELTESRYRIAEVFEEKMMEQLSDLGMEKTVLKVAFSERPEGKALMPQMEGDDSLQFMISPNPGEPLKPLSKIASGGELSRLMLAIKTLESERGGVGTMVFDEIDTGISGRMAQVVAEKMAAIAAKRQVICVTHLPQLAAMANHEMLVEKRVEDGRTRTHIRTLSREERISEIARMLGGADGSGDSARSHADHMLTQAEAYRTSIKNA